MDSAFRRLFREVCLSQGSYVPAGEIMVLRQTTQPEQAFRRCEYCGQPVPLDQTNCANCGGAIPLQEET